MRSSISSVNLQYPISSLRSSSSCLLLLLNLLVICILSSTFHSTTCFRGQFLRKMRPIQLAFQYPISSLRSSNSCLLLLLNLLVISILSSTFHSTTCFRGQFLRKMRPIQLELQYPISSLRSSSSCLLLFLHLLVISILSSTFHSTTCFTGQFLRKMRPIQLALTSFYAM